MKRILLLLGLLLMPVMAFAGPFDPVADDISVKIIDQIFGGLVKGGNDAFGSAISTFNGAVLIIGGILASYTIIAGTLGTAHDGEMLGKKFSSVWIPVRYTLGTAGILPVIGKGYCIFQLAVMWLILQGIGLADMVWDSYMQTPGVAANMTPSVAMRKAALKLAEDTYQLTGCVQANQHVVDHADAVLKYGEKYQYGWKLDGNQWVFGDGKAIFNSGDTQCGNIKFADPVPNSSPTQNKTPTNNIGYLGPLDNLFAPTDVSAINEAHKTATAALITSMATLSKNVIDSDGDIDGPTSEANHKKIEAAADAYVKTIEGAAKGVALNPTDSSKSAHQYGWILAGAYFMNTVITNNKITDAMAAVPASSYKVSYFSETAEATFSKFSKVIDHVKERGLGTNLMDGVIQAATTVDLYELKNDTRHPVIIINEMGSRLHTIWLIIIGVLAAAAGVGILASFTALGKVASVASKFTGFGDKVLVVLGLLSLPLIALAGMAFVAKYLIPMLPFMMWLGVIGGWLIAVVIGVIAAPLWGVVHLHPNGDDLTGRGANGYMMVLSLLLRPVLAIFGFIAAITISSILGEFINKIYFQVFAFSQGDGEGIGWFFGMLAGAAIYVGIMFSFIKKTFSLMHVIPDELMKWIGGGSDQLGHYAGKMGEGSTGGINKVAAAMDGRAFAQNMQNTKRQLSDIDKGREHKKLNDDNKLAAGHKGLNKIGEKMDNNFGVGMSSRMANALGIDADNFNNPETAAKISAFESKMRMVGAAGGPEAQEQFMSELENARVNENDTNFVKFGGAVPAMEDIGRDTVNNSIMSKAESQFGSGAANHISNLAGPSKTDSNMIDVGKANKAIADLGKAQKTLGDNFQSVFQDALNTHGNDAQAVTGAIAIKYNEAKEMEKVAEQQKQVEVKEEIQSELQEKTDTENEK